MLAIDIAKIRKAYGLKWGPFGAMIGRNRTTVMRWEKGERDIPAYMESILENLARKKDLPWPMPADFDPAEPEGIDTDDGSDDESQEDAA